jgi:hypothetical protein
MVGQHRCVNVEQSKSDFSGQQKIIFQAQLDREWTEDAIAAAADAAPVSRCGPGK